MVEQVVHTPGQVVGRCSPALLTDPLKPSSLRLDQQPVLGAEMTQQRLLGHSRGDGHLRQRHLLPTAWEERAIGRVQ